MYYISLCLCSLRLATIISLTPEEPNADLVEFCRAEGIVSRHVAVEKHGESVACTAATIAKVLKVVCARSSHPVYLHCLDGTNNTALVVACLRKLQNWAPVGWLAEFARFSRDATVSAEEAFAVEQFKDEIKLTASQLPRWLWGGRRVAKHASIRIVYRDEREKENRLAAKAALAASNGGSQEPLDAASSLPLIRPSSSFSAADSSIATDDVPLAASAAGSSSPQSKSGADVDSATWPAPSPSPSLLDQLQRQDLLLVQHENSKSLSAPSSRPPHGQRRRTSSITADDIEFDDDAADYDADPLEVVPIVYAPMPWEMGSSSAGSSAGPKSGGGAGERIAAVFYDLMASGGDSQATKRAELFCLCPM